MLVRIPLKEWGILVRIPPSRLGHAHEKWWGKLVRNDTEAVGGSQSS